MKNRKRKLHRVVFVLLSLVLLCQVAAAAECSLRVTLTDEKQVPIAGISVELCCVAAMEDGEFVLTEEFAQLEFSAKELAQQATVEMAQGVWQYVLANELGGTVLATSERGWADFAALEEGVYLVFERGGQAVSFQPYLVSLPTEQDGQMYYNIHSAPKAVSPDSRSIMVMKLWEDRDDAAGRRPDHLKITLCRDGTAIRTVVLNERCGWQHTFHMLPVEGVYTVEETKVRNYEGVCEEVPEGFVLTNTYVPSDEPGHPPVQPSKPQTPEEPTQPELPQEPSLPQTGFRMWPVYALLGLGTVLVLWGLAEVCLGREDT